MKNEGRTKKDENSSDPELVLTFLAMFSRFEKALKKAGFAKPGRTSRADWERYVRQIEGRFDPDATPELQGAVAYLLGLPAGKETIRAIPGSLRDIFKLSALIQETGNNLARRMDFERACESGDEVVLACLLILEAWSHCDPDIHRVLNTIQ